VIHRVLKQTSHDDYAKLESRATVRAFVIEQIGLDKPERAIDILQIALRMEHTFRLKDYETLAYEFSEKGLWRHVNLVTTIGHNATGEWSTRLLNWGLKSYVNLQDYARMGKILDVFEEFGLQPRRTTFHVLVKGYLENSDLFNARDTLERMRSAGYLMDKRLYSIILSAYKALGSNPEVEKQALENLHGLGDPLEVRILNALLRARIAAGDIDGALRILTLANLSSTGVGDTEAPRIKPNVSTYNALFWLLANRGGSLDRMRTLYQGLTTNGHIPDAETIAAIVQAYMVDKKKDHAVTLVMAVSQHIDDSIPATMYAKFGQILDVAEIEKDFPGLISVTPTIKVYNVLLRGILPSLKLRGMKLYFRLLKVLDIMPDTMTTDIVLDHLRKVHDMDPSALVMVVRTLTSFPSFESSLTIMHLNSILAGFIHREMRLMKCHSWNASAQRVRFGHPPRLKPEEMRGDSLLLDPTGGIALETFRNRRSGIVKWILGPMVRSLHRRGIKSSRYTFALRIRREGVIRKDTDAARRVFDLMVSRGITPNQVHYCHMMEGYTAVGEMEQANLMMERAYTNGIKPNVVMFTLLMQGWGRLGRPQEAQAVFGEMIRANVRPDYAAIEALVSAFFFVGAYKTARDLLLDVWPLVEPIPDGLPLNAPLRQLIDNLRALRESPNPNRVMPLDTPIELKRRREVARIVTKILRELRQWRHVAQSIQWAKTDLTWDYILKPKTSSTGERGEYGSEGEL